MLTNNEDLKGLVLRATDGEIGEIDDLYFDDENWAIRYFTVYAGGWLDGRKVLISPHSILQVDWTTRRIDVSLTRKQIENSPDIDTQQPVSRQHEADYLGYYGYPYYWNGPYLWGMGDAPLGLAKPIAASNDRILEESADSHLRSAENVAGYALEATDGGIGHVDRFIVDDETWAIRYLEVATQNWWPGKKVLLSPAWVERVSWADSKVFVATSCDAIRQCPDYDESVPITREYENKVHFHYGRPPYWIEQEKSAVALSAR